MCELPTKSLLLFLSNASDKERLIKGNNSKFKPGTLTDFVHCNKVLAIIELCSGQEHRIKENNSSNKPSRVMGLV